MSSIQANRQPTVCQLLHSLSVGGAEILAARIARQLNNDFRMVFVCLDDLGTLGQELRETGFAVHVLERRNGVDLSCARHLAALLRDERVDIVHAHQYTPFFYALAAGLFRKRPAVLFTEHGRWHPDYPRRKRIIFNRFMLRRRDRVVGVGKSVCRALIANEGIPQRRVQLVYNGIDLNKFAIRPSSRETVRAQLTCRPEDFVMMQVARLDHLKDHGTGLRALERVVREQPRVKLVLVGEGPELDQIRQEVRSRRLESSVRLLGLRTDVDRLLQAADVFLLTSISEGIPLTLIEAMAAGLPVVSTNVGGVSEVVEDGHTGLLAAAGDDDGLAKAILRLSNDRALCASFGHAGRDRAQRLFSEEAMLGAYRSLYEEIRLNRVQRWPGRFRRHIDHDGHGNEAPCAAEVAL